jgi:hypothetical protein
MPLSPLIIPKLRILGNDHSSTEATDNNSERVEYVLMAGNARPLTQPAIRVT